VDARRVVFVAFPGVQILDVTGPMEVFSTATRFLDTADYRAELVSTHGGPVHSSCGLEMATSSIVDLHGPLDTLVAAGGQNMDEPSDDQLLVEHLQRLASQAHRVTSVCSGAFLLAAAGLLDGRRATTHWAECDDLAQRYPEVEVDPDALYVQEGHVWTSAGITAGIDMALALVANDHGRRAAARVARQLVVYLRRSGGQSQFSTLLAAQSADSEPIRELLAWLPDHLADDLSVPALARRVNLSERQFSRRFKDEVSASPAEHVETLRLDAACRLLETTNNPIEEIARVCGFGVTETMNRVFRRRLNTSPGGHRRHFGATDTAVPTTRT
jgi:transcriptional regulator GlxA family with amidase domain